MIINTQLITKRNTQAKESSDQIPKPSLLRLGFLFCFTWNMLYFLQNHQRNRQELWEAYIKQHFLQKHPAALYISTFLNILPTTFLITPNINKVYQKLKTQGEDRAAPHPFQGRKARHSTLPPSAKDTKCFTWNIVFQNKKYEVRVPPQKWEIATFWRAHI